MGDVVFDISGPHRKWEISMAIERVDATSRQDVPFHVAAAKDGRPYDVVTGGVVAKAAFLLDPRAKPAPGDWQACTWDTTLIGTYVALCNVGPGGTVTNLVAGKTYCTWLQLTSAGTGELVAEQTGQLIVE